MKSKFLRWILIFLLPWLTVQSAAGQVPNAKCMANIQNQLDRFTNFGTPQINKIIKKFEYGKPSDLADPDKARAFNRLFESLSEFCLLCGDDLTEKGMEGYVKFSSCLIRHTDDAVSQLNITHLKEAFTNGGVFNGKHFNNVMSELADETKYVLDPVSRTFTSKTTGLKFGDGPALGKYGQGEYNAISHIVRGHVANDFSNAASKSIFSNPSEIFDLIDRAWLNPSKTTFSNNGWIVDFSPKIIGTNGEMKIRIHIDGDYVRSAFPIN